MTIVQIMDIVSDFIREVLNNHYSTAQENGTIAVYSGYPPVRTSSSEKQSYVYCLCVSAVDDEEPDYSQATIEIGCSIYDSDTQDGWRSLANVLEHIRQALLTHRHLKGRASLELPLKVEFVDDQPFPQWQGKITAIYSIGQPKEEVWEFNQSPGTLMNELKMK